MRYIVSLHNFIDAAQVQEIEDLNAEIIFRSAFLPIIGIEISEKYVGDVNKLYYVESVRLSREGEYAPTITFQPPLRKSLLRNLNLVGWGDTRVVVIDSGVNGHNLVESKDFTGRGYYDTQNHGTRVAQIIKHFAPGCNLYSAKIGVERPDELCAIEALEWAFSKGIKIANISSSFNYPPKVCSKDKKCELCKLIDILEQKGMAVVVAAGNVIKGDNRIYCPAKTEGAIAVGASSEDQNKLARFSCCGQPGDNKPNILAPGEGYIDGEHFQGTSFAAPVITGVLAAILPKFQSVSAAINCIYYTAEDINLPKHQQGVGSLNLARLTEVVSNEETNINAKEQKRN